MDHFGPQLNSELAASLVAAEADLPAGQVNLLLENVQRLAGIGLLTAGIAQELSNLLDIVTTATISLRHELQQGAVLDEDSARHYMKLIERNAFRSAQIVTLLQEYGTFDKPRMALTDVGTILRDTLLLVERQFREESNVRIDIQSKEEARSIVCDHRRVVQLLVNLLNNARDSLQDSGGLIEVNVRLVHSGGLADLRKPALDYAEQAERIAITISSGTGPLNGPPQALSPTPAANKTHDNGFGLRSRVSQEIVQQHRGEILVANGKGPGEGASITVVLPLRPMA